MAERTSYTPGTPCWTDLASPDLTATKAFYGGLFGWQTTDPAPETGEYVNFTLHGKRVAGLNALMNEEQPAVWATYIATADADATVARAEAAGGTSMFPPMDVTDLGRMGFVFDTAGAAIGLWQPGTFAGAELVNEPGTVVWNELNVRDREAPKAFYADVFGLEARDVDTGGQPYTEFRVGDAVVGGMVELPPDAPAQIPAHWLVYIAVEDCAASVARAQELGAHLAFGPMTVPVGTLAVLADPHGSMFAVIQMAEAPA